MNKQQIQLYTSEDGQVQLEIQFEQETLWLTQAQIADLFEVNPQNITMHLQNVYAEGELAEVATCKESLQVQMEGTRQVKRQRKTYNLDAVISVGYRVNSSRA
ncbi:MAG: RhuM family protein, partial [Porticoccaceae bacterium]|nr:RhuM family protein [Porticoccaceae bacterium]